MWVVLRSVLHYLRQIDVASHPFLDELRGTPEKHCWAPSEILQLLKMHYGWVLWVHISYNAVTTGRISFEYFDTNTK
ncbi:unnamed protein product, partial [Iphiclides podalirius]